MATFTITFDDGKTEDVANATDFIDEGDWITFRKVTSGRREQLLRVRAKDVKRIDRKG